MNLFRKAKAASTNTETIMKPSEKTKHAWWSIFIDFMAAAVDDEEDLLRSRDPEHARRVAQAARHLADAALAEYEERWAEVLG